MALVNLNHVRGIFSSELSAEEKRETFKEMLIMILARATRVDYQTDESEVLTVQSVIKKITGEEISEADIRVAASSEVFETAPLSKYLSRIAPQLDTSDCLLLINALKDVLYADEHIRESEVDYFNMVARALNLSPAEIVGLTVN